MNNIREEKKDNQNLKIFYITIISICVIAIILALVLQIKQENDIDTGANIGNSDNVQINTQKERFNNIFQNKVNYLENNAYKLTKINKNEEVSMTILNKICAALGVSYGDIIEYVPHNVDNEQC